MLDETLRGTNCLVAKTGETDYVMKGVMQGGRLYLQYENDALIKRMCLIPTMSVFYKERFNSPQGEEELRQSFSYRNKLNVNDFAFDPNLFYLLVDHGVIRFSKEMAGKYNLPKKGAYNYGYKDPGLIKEWRHRPKGKRKEL